MRFSTFGPEFSKPYTSASLIALQLLILLPTCAALPRSSRLIYRQSSSLSSLQIPQCALGCFINALTNDGCAEETDFKCHCSTGNILSVAASCVDESCDKADQQDAIAKVKAGCLAVGVNTGGGSGSDGSSGSAGTTSSTQGSASLKKTTALSSTAALTSSNSPPSLVASSSQTASTTTLSTTTTPTPIISSSPPAATRHPSKTPTPPMPTNTPLARLPTIRSLSTSAKVGISLSVSILFTSLLIIIVLYIRRLKRELHAAQAAAGIPDSVWRAHISTTTAASPPMKRSSSWRSIKSRRSSWRGRSPPVSPLSPGSGSMSEAAFQSLNGEGSILKKNRGHILSVVVERAEEDDDRVRMVVREPVPGQSEGIADALELDGHGTEVVELPISVTPRTRSRERSGSRGRSLSLERLRLRPRGRSFGNGEVGDWGKDSFG